MANYSGGYILIDLTGKAIYGDGTTVKGIYDALESNSGKPVLFKNILTAEDAYPFTAFASVIEVNGTTFDVTIGKAYIISVSESDDVTITALE